MVRSDDASQPVSAADLVRLFFDEATAAFAPWVHAQGGRWSCTLTHTNAEGDFEPTTPDRLYGFFLAEGEFRTPHLIGEIAFGDKEFFINTVVSPLGRPLRHGLWEWADAVGMPDIPPRETDFVLQPDRMRTIVRGMAEALQLLAPAIATAAADVVQRMEEARAVVRAAQKARWREAEHAGTVHLANEAFRQKDWRQVIDLLMSVKDRLSPAEAAKLRYARSQAE